MRQKVSTLLVVLLRNQVPITNKHNAFKQRSEFSELYRKRGFTLLEVIIYLAVMAIISIPIMLTAVTVTRSTEEGNLLAVILERNRSAMHRIAGDFRRCISGTITVTNSGRTLTFTFPGGFDGTGPTNGNVISYQIQDDPSDSNNGTDDNGNGVVDEKILVRINQTTNETVTIGAFLNEADSGFVVNGTGINLTMTTIGWKKGSQATTKMTQTMSIFPRN